MEQCKKYYYWLGINLLMETEKDYFDHPNCIGWTRLGSNDHEGYAFLISNGDCG